MKKILSVLLSFVFVFGNVSLIVVSAETAAGKVPTIYIVGGNQVMRDPVTGEQKWDIQIPDGYIEDAVKDCVGDLLKAAVTGSDADIEAYKTKLLSWVAPLYEEVRCDKNGVPLNELTVCMDYNPDRPFELGESVDDRIYNGYYPIHGYDFYYDWRADLFLSVGELEQYVDMVREATGSEKVNLVGRCEGASLILAYLQHYGSEKLNRILLYTPTSEEYMLVSQTYAGKIRFSFAEITTWMDNNRYLTLNALPVGGELLELLDATMRMAAGSPLGLSGAALNRVYDRIFRRVLPDVLLATYANMPATWSMVSDADYEEALAFVFAGRETEYAGLIGKIRAYHNTVGAVSDSLLLDAAANGVHIGVVTKYGYPAIPLFEESAMLSDGSSLIRYTSYGATAANQYETLPDDYIEAQIMDGKGAYLSPDRKIDASTCLFPETTWFVGGIDHDDFPWCIDLFLEQFMLSETPMTVNADPTRPQFMLYQNGGIVPMTAENAEYSVIGTPEGQEAFGSNLSRLIKSLTGILTRIVDYIRAIIEGIVNHATGNV